VVVSTERAGAGTRHEDIAGSATSNGRERHRRLTSKYGLAVLLLGIALAAGCIAYLWFPDEASVRTPLPFGIGVGAVPGTTVGNIDIQVSSDRGASRLRIMVGWGATKRLSTHLEGIITVSSSSDHAFDCQPIACTAGISDGQGNYLYDLYVPMKPYDDVLPDVGPVKGASGSASIAFPASNLAWSANRSTVLGVLPSVVLTPPGVGNSPIEPLRAPKGGGPPPGVQFEYLIPGLDRFDWTGGPRPQLVAHEARWSFLATEVLSASPSGIGSPGQWVRDEADFSATDRNAERHDNAFLFLAGALAGIAGGAFIGAIQEGWHSVTE
jgi:hypothetical protein